MQPMHPNAYQNMIAHNARLIQQRLATYGGIKRPTKSMAKSDRALIRRHKAWKNVPAKNPPTIKAPVYEWMSGSKVWC